MSVKDLTGDLKFARIDNFAALIADLEDVNAPVKISEINCCFGGELVGFEHFLSYEAVNLYVILLVVVVLKIKVDQCGSRVGIKAHDLLHRFRPGKYRFRLSISLRNGQHEKK